MSADLAESGFVPSLAATLNRGYADRFGRPENEHGTVTVDTIGLEYSDSTWLLLNFFGKGVAVIRSPADGWLEAPGIVPEERENGLHLSLLSHTLAHLPGDAAGWRMVSFNDPDPWLEDYRQAGFQISRTHHLYRKDL